ncbi:hypothetical protein [Rhodocista pekingensis]|uniref:Uncharacterized protein n=1 Tax=Rhodocista pekingensis TaxID=201185 RepID=A0ABW2KSM6_9PROT
MLGTVLLIVDVLAIGTALLSAVLWFQASGRTLRRVSFHEELDARDLNRIVTAFNRSTLLNRRAALATAAAAGLTALKWLVALLAG